MPCFRADFIPSVLALRFRRVFMPSTRLVEGVENAGSVGCLFRVRFHGVFMRVVLGR